MFQYKMLSSFGLLHTPVDLKYRSTESQIGRDLNDHLVQPFLAKAQSR